MAEFSQDNALKMVLEGIEHLNHLKDVDAILDHALFEARRLTGAEAGSIFLVEAGELVFRYVHNDALFKVGRRDLQYQDLKLPIDKESIVGYTALTEEVLFLDDVYDLPDGAPYRFNPEFDEKFGYRTQSMLTLPLVSEDRIAGVLQLINAKDSSGAVIPFSKRTQDYLPMLLSSASAAIQRGIMTRDLVLHMVKMAELRDPKETGAHVQRVGAYASEIYKQWALDRDVDNKEVQRISDRIRLAAMLHDVGKVGISDAILKKPGKLTDEEFEIMTWHTVYGAKLFLHQHSDLELMCGEIALHHHQKWAGNGYPDRVELETGEGILCEGRLKGEEIPLTARVTAVADVFDALVSQRCYKDAWPIEKALSLIEEESGSHFDPGVVEAFFQIEPVIRAIKERYREKE